MLWALLPLAAGPMGAAAMLGGENALSEAPKCAGKSWGVRVVLGGCLLVGLCQGCGGGSAAECPWLLWFFCMESWGGFSGAVWEGCR